MQYSLYKENLKIIILDIYQLKLIMKPQYSELNKNVETSDVESQSEKPKKILELQEIL